MRVLPAFRQCNLSISAPCGNIFLGKRYVCNLVSIQTTESGRTAEYNIHIYTYTRPGAVLRRVKHKQPNKRHLYLLNRVNLYE